MKAEPANSLMLENLLAEREWLRRMARVLVADPSSADDLAQDTWAAALTAPPRDASQPRAWLATVTRNLARRRARGESRRSAREHAVAAGETQHCDPVDALIRAELRQSVANAVMSLDEPARTTVVLRWFEGLSVAEIAVRTGDTPVAIRARLRRALEILRARLDREYGGDRQRWSAPLLVLAGRPAGPRLPGGAEGAAATLGGLIVTTKTKCVLAAALALLIAGFVGGVGSPFGRSSDRASDSSAPTASATASDVGVDPRAADGDPAPRERTRVDTASDELPGPDAAPAPDDDAPEHRVVVTVQRPDGQPVEGIVVIVTNTSGLFSEGTTNTSGRAIVDGKSAPRSVFPRLTEELRAQFLPPSRRELDEGARDVTFVLTAGVTMRGRVLAPDGSAIASTYVTAHERPSGRAIRWILTGDDGRFRVLLAEGATVDLSLDGVIRERNGPPTALVHVEVPWAGRWTGVVPGAEERDFRATTAAAVDVRVRVEMPDGTPVPGAVVKTTPAGHSAKSAWGHTDAEGRCVLAAVPARSRSVSIDVEKAELPAGRWVTPPPRVVDASTPEVTFVMQRAASISGRVVREDGERVTWCRVELLHGDESIAEATSAGDGTFDVALPEDAPAPLRILVRSFDRERRIYEGDTTDVWPGAKDVEVSISLLE